MRVHEIEYFGKTQRMVAAGHHVRSRFKQGTSALYGHTVGFGAVFTVDYDNIRSRTLFQLTQVRSYAPYAAIPHDIA